MRMLVPGSSLPSVQQIYNVVILGSGKRASEVHKAACEKQAQSNATFRYKRISNRSFLDMDNVGFKSNLWVMAVPKQYRFKTYLHILKAEKLSNRFIILAETPASLVDIFFSLLPFVKVRIAESAHAKIKASRPPLLSPKFSYFDQRIGMDHGYAIYFKYLGLFSGMIQLLLMNVFVAAKKNDKLGFEVTSRDVVSITHLTPEARLENEIDFLSVFYADLISEKRSNLLNIPLSNLLLKTFFRIFSRRK